MLATAAFLQEIKINLNVCIQGLGFVGSAMAAAVSKATDDSGNRLYNVVGVDLPTVEGSRRIDSVNNGLFPFEASDISLKQTVAESVAAGCLSATSDLDIYRSADIVVVDVHLDLGGSTHSPEVDYSDFVNAIETVGMAIPKTALVLVETTVPPGTCEKIVLPVLQKCFESRGFSADDVRLAHSYERVMPGSEYLNSITNFWRVYSGLDERSAKQCELFLRSVVNTTEYPLTRLASMKASETAKVLENSYRAMNIAFMEEWGRFAEAVGIDIFEVVEAIRLRPTHSNIRQPGFGVGGYCLTKDPLFTQFSANNLFETDNLDFEFCRLAVETNKKMPLATVEMLRRNLADTLKDRCILLMGVAYRQGVADTRYSPSTVFAEEMRKEESILLAQDPLVKEWEGCQIPVNNKLCAPEPNVDAVVFAVPHTEYGAISPADWLHHSHRPLIVDANCVLTKQQRDEFQHAGCRVVSVGRG